MARRRSFVRNPQQVETRVMETLHGLGGSVQEVQASVGKITSLLPTTQRPSVATVYRAVRRLEAMGAIAVESNGKGSRIPMKIKVLQGSLASNGHAHEEPVEDVVERLQKMMARYRAAEEENLRLRAEVQREREAKEYFQQVTQKFQSLLVEPPRERVQVA